MACPETTGMIVNILGAVFDDNAATYPSGKVNLLIFKDLNVLNAIMGTCFSGNANDGCVMPSISGTAYQAILELLVAKDLTGGSLMTASRGANLLSFKEGDSTVTISDTSRNLQLMYTSISQELDRIIKSAKYNIASRAVTTVVGADAGIQETIPYQGYNIYRPYGV